jgi:hypothetical protein
MNFAMVFLKEITIGALFVKPLLRMRTISWKGGCLRMGGYYIDNGASLCGDCHIKAEQTVICPHLIRAVAGIRKIVLSPHLYPDYEYDKWGNIVNNNGSRIRGELFNDESVQKILQAGGVLDSFLPYVKYPRTFHLPFSQGRTDDDRALKDCSVFENKSVVITIKMDGENTTGYQDGYIHARSLDGRSHPSRNWVKNFLSPRLVDLPRGWRISGENLYAKHSIAYKGLGSYFHGFSIWDEKNECLSWAETLEWFELLDIKPVPTLYRGPWKELVAKAYGSLVESGLYPDFFPNTMEGFVVRLSDKFHYSQFSKSVAKFVRSNHIQTNKHWQKESIVKNEL